MSYILLAGENILQNALPYAVNVHVITGPPNEPVLLCSLVSVGICHRHLSSSVTVPTSRPPGAWAVGRPTLHSGPVLLRPVRATPCCKMLERWTHVHI